MEPTSPEKSSINSKNLQNAGNHLPNEYEIDENEKKLIDFISKKEKFKIKSYYEHEKDIFDFLSSKYQAMEKINLDDEYFLEGEIKTKTNKENKNLISKSKNKKNKRKSSRKKSEKKK